MTRRTQVVAGTLTLILALAPALAAAATHPAPSPEAPRAFPHAELLSPLGRAIEADPLHAADLGRSIAARQAAAPLSLARAVELATEQGRGHAVASAPIAPRALAAAIGDAGHLSAAQRLDVATRAAKLDPRVQAAISILVDGTSRAQRERGTDPFARVTPSDLATMVQASSHASTRLDAAPTSAALLGPGEPAPLLDMQAALAHVDLDAIWTSHATMAQAVDEAIALLQTRPATVGTGIVFEQGTPYGDILVYGSGADTHARDAFIEIDLGGDDVYVDRTGSSTADILGLENEPVPSTDPNALAAWAAVTMDLVHKAHNASVSIDVGGNDQYVAAGPGYDGFGSFGGFGALVDLAGDDAYTGSILAQGSGELAGAGFLVDAQGADRYLADQQAQAFALGGGGGFLLDGTGDDVYDAQVLAQATGYDADVMALLADGSGNDRYTCAGVANFQDSILPVSVPRPGSTCHATGFGGTAILLDGQGDDAYTTVSSFQAMTLIGGGLLVDGGGRDQLVAGEWSNGVGVEGGAAVVMGAGDTTYSSISTVGPWGDVYVGSNGEGYLGAGALVDAAGADTYVATTQHGLWLEQFACSEGCSYIGGVGVLVDATGDDAYDAEVGQGGAFIGTSVLVDGAGNDRYTLASGGTRGQAYAESNPLIVVLVPIQPSSCQDAILVDGDGVDSYSNPVTTVSARGDDQWWGQNDFARGMDGTSGIAGYATSQQFQDDANKIVSTRDCEELTPVVLALLCQLTGNCL